MARVPSRRPTVLLALGDLPQVDQITDELESLGLEVLTAFSTSEAIGAATAKPPDVALLDEDLEDVDHLKRWIARTCQATVCLVHEFGPPAVRVAPADDELAPNDEPASDDEEATQVAARLLAALALVRKAHLAPGPA